MHCVKALRQTHAKLGRVATAEELLDIACISIRRKGTDGRLDQVCQREVALKRLDKVVEASLNRLP